MKNGAIVGFGRLASGAGRNQEVFPKIWQPHSIMGGINSLPNATLRAVCDPNLELMNQLDEGISKYADHKDLLEREDLDFLAIATRAPMRLKIATDAINAGCKKLHLEKPLCTNLAELENFSSLIYANSVVFTYGAIRRYLEPYKIAKQLVHSNYYGPLRELRVNYGLAPLFWTHSHFIDLMLYFIESEPVNVKVDANHLRTSISGKSLIVENDPIIQEMTIEFKNGKIGKINSKSDMSLELIFQDGVLIIDKNGERMSFKSNHDTLLTLDKIWDQTSLTNPQGYSLVIGELLDFQESAILGKQDIYRSMSDALSGQRILFMIVDTLLAQQGLRSDQIESRSKIFLGLGPTNLPA